MTVARQTVPEYLTVAEVANLLRVTPEWVRAHSGRNARRQPVLPCIQLGSVRRFDPSELERTLALHNVSVDRRVA